MNLFRQYRIVTGNKVKCYTIFDHSTNKKIGMILYLPLNDGKGKVTWIKLLDNLDLYESDGKGEMLNQG